MSNKKLLEYPTNALATKDLRMEQQNLIDYMDLKEKKPKKFMEKFIALSPYRIIFEGLHMVVTDRTEQYALIGVSVRGTNLNFHAPPSGGRERLSTVDRDEYLDYIYNVTTVSLPKEKKLIISEHYEKYKSNPLAAMSILVRQNDKDTLIKLSDIFTSELIVALKDNPADTKVIESIMSKIRDLTEKKDIESLSISTKKSSKKKVVEEDEPLKKSKTETKKRKKVEDEEEEPVRPTAGKRKKKEEKQNMIVDSLDSEQELKFLRAIKWGLAEVFGIQEKDAPLLLQVIKQTVDMLNEK